MRWVVRSKELSALLTPGQSGGQQHGWNSEGVEVSEPETSSIAKISISFNSTLRKVAIPSRSQAI